MKQRKRGEKMKEYQGRAEKLFDDIIRFRKNLSRSELIEYIRKDLVIVSKIGAIEELKEDK